MANQGRSSGGSGKESAGTGGFRKAFEKWTSDAAAGESKKLPKARVMFTLSADVAPEVFDQDMEVVLESLSQGDELRVAKAAKGDPLEMAYRMARECVVEVDGEALGLAEREWFWEAIGQGGRQVIVHMYQQVGTANEDVLGKAMKSLAVE